jgi:hypothetical protein
MLMLMLLLLLMMMMSMHILYLHYVGTGMFLLDGFKVLNGTEVEAPRIIPRVLRPNIHIQSH